MARVLAIAPAAMAVLQEILQRGFADHAALEDVDPARRCYVARFGAGGAMVLEDALQRVAAARGMPSVRASVGLKTEIPCGHEDLPGFDWHVIVQDGWELATPRSDLSIIIDELNFSKRPEKYYA